MNGWTLKDHLVEEEHHLPNLHFWFQHVKFPGCNIRVLEIKLSSGNKTPYTIYHWETFKQTYICCLFWKNMYMSCGRNYVHGELAMSKLGGPLSVVKVLNFLRFHYLKCSRFQRLFHCGGVLISCQPWVACWPCVFSSLSWFCFAG